MLKYDSDVFVLLNRITPKIGGQKVTRCFAGDPFGDPFFGRGGHCGTHQKKKMDLSGKGLEEVSLHDSSCLVNWWSC